MTDARLVLAAAGLCLVPVGTASAGEAKPHPKQTIRFTDVTKESGLSFRHLHGGTGEKYMCETMGSGLALFDMDDDGDLDLLFIQSGPLPGQTFEGKRRKAYPNRLYENDGKGRFRDVTRGSGIEGRGYGMGAAVGDYDLDGRPDVYITCFGKDELYRNLGGGKFRDVTSKAHLANDLFGASAAFADFDLDGDLDLYVTNYLDFTMDHNVYCGERKPGMRAYCHPDAYKPEPHILYENMGDGTFRDITKAAGVDLRDGKGLGVVAGDYDGDGLIDLYVANDSTRNFLLRNVSAVKAPDFQSMNSQEVKSAQEIESPELLAANGRQHEVPSLNAADFQSMNLQEVKSGPGIENPELLAAEGRQHEVPSLKKGRRTIKFEDETLLSGAGYSETGKTEAGMGVDMADADGDGDLDLFVTNLDLEPNELYQNRGDGSFRVATFSSGLGEVSLPFVGFGTGFLDVDNDGDLDILVGNGHIIDNIDLYRKHVTYAQRKHLFLNNGQGRFKEVAADAGADKGNPLLRQEVTRGLAFGDIDNDGDIDVVAANNNSAAVLLRNDSESKGRSITLVLEGKKGNPKALGARVAAEIAGHRLVREARRARSYLASNDPRIHIGLGTAKEASEITIHWPGGKTTKLTHVGPGFHRVKQP